MCHVDTGPVVHDSVPAASTNQGETDITTVHDNGTHKIMHGPYTVPASLPKTVAHFRAAQLGLPEPKQNGPMPRILPFVGPMALYAGLLVRSPGMVYL